MNSDENGNANRPPRVIIDAGGEYFLNPPPNLDLREVVLSRAPGHYPPGHEAPLRHPEDRQQVVAYQQEEPQQHQYMAPPIMQQAPPMLPQHHMAPQMHEQYPPVYQPQPYMPPMMPPQPIVVSGQGQYIPNAPPQPTMMLPPNVVTVQGQWIPFSTMTPPWVVPVPQPAENQYYGGYPPQQPPSYPNPQFTSIPVYNVDSQPQPTNAQCQQVQNCNEQDLGNLHEDVGQRREVTLEPQLDDPNKYVLKVNPGDRIVIEQSVKLESSLGSVVILADKENPVIMTHSTGTPISHNTGKHSNELKTQDETRVAEDADRGRSEDANVSENVQETENVEEPKVQSPKPVMAETVKAQKTPEEPAQQPILPIVEDSVQQQSIQQSTVTEKPAQQPEEQPAIEFNQPAMETLNINDNVGPETGNVGRTYAKMASQPRAPQPAVVSSAQASTNQPPKPKQVHARAPEFVTQDQRPRQTFQKVAHKPPPPPLCKPVSNDWITVGTSSSGPSSRQEEPVFVLKAPQPKPTVSEKVEEQRNLQEEVEEPMIEAPKTELAKKKNKKPGKPTPSKAERKAQERAESELLEDALASAQEEKVLFQPLSEYVESRTSFRSMMVRDDYPVNCVDVTIFEQKLLTYIVENKFTNWPSKKEEVKRYLEKQMNGRKTSQSPQDQKLVLKYRLLIDKLSPAVIQDVSAIRGLHPTNWAQVLETEYFNLVFCLDRDLLVLNCQPKEIQTTLKDPNQQRFDMLINIYVNRQTELRARKNLNGVSFKVDTDEWLNTFYFKRKTAFCALLASRRTSLVQMFYRYWNWQYDQVKKHLPRDNNYDVKVAMVYSMISRDVSNPLDDVLLCDLHMFIQSQPGLYKEAVDVDKLQEKSMPYLYLVLVFH